MSRTDFVGLNKLKTQTLTAIVFFL